MFQKLHHHVRMTAIAACVSAFCGASSVMAATYYVNANNPAVNGDGSSWADAARHINDVLPLAAAGDEIWVTAGVYYPDRTLFDPFGTGDRNATFELKSGVKLLGGFVGGETDSSQRDPSMNITILSGDIGVAGSHGDNSRSILTAINVDSLCVVDGLTIVRGNCSDGTSSSGADSLGGGIYMSGSSLQVLRCTFDQNAARGGAAIGAINSSPQIQDCVFLNGNAVNRGGGIEFTSCPNPLVIDCEFRSNTAYFGGCIYANSNTGGTFQNCKFIQGVSVNGGGLFFAGFSSTRVISCLFLKNECKQLTFFQTSFDGGAVKNWCASTVFVNCIFNSNYARGQGGAFYDAGPSGASGTLINCTFFNNTARDGGVVAAANGHTPTLRNCLTWDNPIVDYMGSVVVTDSANGMTGGMIPNPFQNVSGVDGVVGTEDDDFRLSADSNWINMGLNGHIPAYVTTDYLGNARIYDGIVDLGAIEFAPPPPPHCEGDANGDNMVNFDDITAIISNWLSAGPEGDADDNGIVNFEDIATVITNFGNGCTPF